MNPDARPVMGKGVRLRREDDGSSMLLIPEGALLLNASAYAALDLIDGRRTMSEIVRGVVDRFEVSEETAFAEIGALFERLAERHFISV